MKLNYKLSKKQMQFMNATATEVLFGGAAGGGKSYGQLIDALLYALKYQGSVQILMRRTYPDLERSLIMVAMEIYPKWIYSYNSSNHKMRLKNGSIIWFGYSDTEKDVVRQYQGAEFDVIRLDELTHFTEYQYLYMLSRLRGTKPFPRQMKCSTNPGGVGHSWVKKRWIDSGEPEVVHDVVNENGKVTGTAVFIPSFVADNSFLMESDPEYVERLEALPEKERKALLLGQWDIMDGQYFYEWEPQKHTCKPFEIPKHWRRYVSIDYGMDMLAGLWVAVDEQNHAYVYKMVYKSKLIISAAASALKEMNGTDEIDAWLSPPDLWNARQETGKSVADIFAEHGINLVKTSNNRVQGWLAVREWLALRPDEFGGESPNLKVFTSCHDLIRTLPALQMDEKKPEDVANEPHELTHAPDALRGFCVYWTSKANKPAGKRAKWQADQWEDYRNASERDKQMLIEQWGEPE